MDSHGTAILHFQNLITALALYRSDTDRYPSTEEGPAALVEDPGQPGWNGPYLLKGLRKDPWGGDFQYRFLAESRDYEIRSDSRDGPGGISVRFRPIDRKARIESGPDRRLHERERRGTRTAGSPREGSSHIPNSGVDQVQAAFTY